MLKKGAVNITTLISKVTEVKGDVHFSGALEIEGKVIGKISADEDSSAEVRIRESGVVNGDISAPSIIINGLVEGDVRASKYLEMAAKAKVVGNVYYTSMEMVMGAEINGNVHRDDSEEVKRIGVDKPKES